jgi:catechol 2,3-dioxygenase-like lactoylglutathione lyase family enzyme
MNERMFTHFCVGVNDLAVSARFYDAVMKALGYEVGTIYGDQACVYATEAGKFILTRPNDAGIASFGNGITIGFAASSTASVDAFHAAGLANGGTDEGVPGPRVNAGGAYGAYLRDPVGNKLCAFHGLD